jgi:hypothetical protein
MKKRSKITELGLAALAACAVLTAVSLSDTANAATRHYYRQYGAAPEWTYNRVPPRVYDRFSSDAGEGYDPVPPSANN